MTVDPLDRVKAEVLAKLYGISQPKTHVGLERQYENVYGMLKSTVTLRRGDSCLLMGPRSSGKSLLVSHILRDLESAYPNQFMVIRLSGFLHTDDRQAVRAIAKQLDIETALQDENADSLEKTSMAVTMQNILEIFQQASYSESNDAVSVIFWIEEIDSFLSSKQTLLYNLLDMCQNSPIGVAVVGVSCRMNAGELFEKRVRSRFSQRLYEVTKSNSLSTFIQVCNEMLKADSNTDAGTEVWNQRIDELSAEPGSLRRLIESVYYSTKDARQFGALAAVFLVGAHGLPEDSWFNNNELSDLNQESSTVTLIGSLSELDWALVICAARSASKFSLESVNLALVQDEYQQMAQKTSVERAAGSGVSGYRIWSSRVVKHSWERLQQLDLLVATSASQAVQEELKMLKPEIRLQELRKFLPADHPLYSWIVL